MTYSIRWLEADAGACAACGRATGRGPVAWSDEDPAGPLCDVCLSVVAPPLGMLLQLALELRELGEAPHHLEHKAARVAHLAELWAGASDWPPRRSSLLEVSRRVSRDPADELERRRIAALRWI